MRIIRSFVVITAPPPLPPGFGGGVGWGVSSQAKAPPCLGKAFGVVVVCALGGHGLNDLD